MASRLSAAAIARIAPGVESGPELILLNRIAHAGLPAPETQARLIPGRRFAFDLAWPAQRLAVEVEGGVWLAEHGRRGAHSTGKGIVRDIEKANLATLHGWRLLRVTPEMIASGEAVALIAAALEREDS